MSKANRPPRLKGKLSNLAIKKIKHTDRIEMSYLVQ